MAITVSLMQCDLTLEDFLTLKIQIRTLIKKKDKLLKVNLRRICADHPVREDWWSSGSVH